MHATLTGTRAGRSWGTTQLNRALFVALCAQFQRFCRKLHDEAIDVQLGVAHRNQVELLDLLLRRGRRLETANPRPSALGSDFMRLRINLIAELRRDPTNLGALADLDRLLDFRNAIGHGDEPSIEVLTATGDIAATKASYLRYRRTLDGLARTMDRVVAEKLAVDLDIPKPW